MATVFEFLEAGTVAQMLDYAARNPVLLRPEADDALAMLARRVNADGRGDLAVKLTECRRMLNRMRTEGGQEAVGATASGPIPAELMPLVARITRLGDSEADMRERVDLLRRVVARTDPRTHAGLWVSMQSMLGATLGDISERDGALDFDEAIAALEATLPVLAGMPEESRTLAVNRHNLGMFHSHRRAGASAGDIDAAIGHLRAALDHDDRLPPRLAIEALRELAALYLDRHGPNLAADIEEAIACAGRALTLIDRTESPVEWAVTARLLGSAYMLRLAGVRRDNLTEALGHLNAAEALVDRGAHRDVWAAIQLSLGSVYREGVIGPQAEAMERAIDHFRSAADVAGHLSPRRRAEAFNGLGTAYLDRVLGDPAANVATAIGHFEQVRVICRAAAMTYEDAVAARNLAMAYVKRDSGSVDDNIDRAIGLLDEAAARFSDVDTPYDHAAVLMIRGNAYLGRGREGRASNLGKAVEALLAADAILRRVGALREAALCRVTLANAYLAADRSHVEAAVDSLETALAEFRRQGLVVEQATALDALGRAWAKSNPDDRVRSRAMAVDRAIGYHMEALQVLGDPATALELWVMIQSNLGTAHLERGSDGPARDRDLDAAVACLQDAVTVGAGRRLGSTGGLAMTRINLGIALTERAARGRPGDLPDAVTHLESGFEAVAADGVPLQRLIAGRALAEAYERTGARWTDAASAYGEALAAADSLYTSALLRSDIETELTAASGLHRSAAYAAALAGDLGRAVVWLERGRARSLGDALARDQAELNRIETAHPRLVTEFRDAARDVRESETVEWATTTGTPGGPIGGPAAARIGEAVRRGRIRQARVRLDAAVEAIRRAGHTDFLRQPELADITSAAARTGPIAYLATTGHGCLTLLVATDHASGSPTVRRLPPPDPPLTTQTLNAILVRSDDARPHRGYLREQNEPGAAGLVDALDELLPILGRDLMRPLAEAVEECGGRGVTIVACGLLGLLPLHAATYTRDGSPRTLLDELVVAYAPSVRVLDVARSRCDRLDHRVAPPGGVLVGVGDPHGGAPLPNAAFETQQIGGLFERKHTFYWTEATRTTLIEAAPGATHVHLACHGTFEASDPLESSLSLAGDDRLTLRDILKHRPFRDARLVVASACRTAVVDFLHLPDEVAGLPSGLLRAGTPGVIGTLWPVEDLSTALLMIRFYEELVDAVPEPSGPAAALRSAQRWLAHATVADLNAFVAAHDPGVGGPHPRRDLGPDVAYPDTAPHRRPADDRPFAHPYFWAPFVFVGA